MDVIGHKYDSFVQRELQKRAAASRKEGMQVGVLPALLVLLQMLQICVAQASKACAVAAANG